MPLKDDIQRAVKIALDEDIGTGDITANLIPQTNIIEAHIITRDHCIFCGADWLDETYRQLGGVQSILWHVADGSTVAPNQRLVSLTGNARTILTGERTALNFMQLLSATATVTKNYVNQLGSSAIKLLDTRKTIPGLRSAQKYAVTVGGGHNHRMGLFDAFLIKENHIAACGSIRKAINSARKLHPEKPVEVEVETLQELEEAIDASADIVMLDNFSHADLRQAMTIDKKNTRYELSGNLTIDEISQYKDYTIDYMSFGALTKNVKAVDLSLRVSK